jgi:hypothetical protein
MGALVPRARVKLTTLQLLFGNTNRWTPHRDRCTGSDRYERAVARCPGRNAAAEVPRDRVPGRSLRHLVLPAQLRQRVLGHGLTAGHPVSNEERGIDDTMMTPGTRPASDPDLIDHAVDELHHGIRRNSLAILEATSGIKQTVRHRIAHRVAQQSVIRAPAATRSKPGHTLPPSICNNNATEGEIRRLMAAF